MSHPRLRLFLLAAIVAAAAGLGVLVRAVWNGGAGVVETAPTPSPAPPAPGASKPAAKLTVHAAPIPAPTAPFKDAQDRDMTLASFQGRYTLVNFWATWCAPCRVEMPSLDRLAAQIGPDTLRIATVAVERGGLYQAGRMLDELGITRLERYADPTLKLGFGLIKTPDGTPAPLVLPVTILLNPDGAEIARLVGGTEWDTPEIRDRLKELIGGR